MNPNYHSARRILSQAASWAYRNRIPGKIRIAKKYRLRKDITYAEAKKLTNNNAYGFTRELL